VLSALVALAFFFSFWGVNAKGLGRHDMGIGLALSFAVPVTVYASLACAVLVAVGTAAAAWRKRPLGLWLSALGVSLLPILFLALVDLL